MKLSFTPNDPHSILLVLEDILEAAQNAVEDMDSKDDEFKMLQYVISDMESAIEAIENTIQEFE